LGFGVWALGLKLNVGCGTDTWGDIRLDLDRNYWRGKKQNINLFADARFLPFIDNCFIELRAFHVLEHIEDWKQALREFCRVSKKLCIEVPKEPSILNNWLEDIKLRIRVFLKREKKCSYGRHLWKFDPETLVLFLRNLGFNKIEVKTFYSSIVPFRHIRMHACILPRPFKRIFSYRIQAEKVKN
jgi:ubiquinone/menaquinone biosynthesis C-methylase UbiE